MQKSLQSCKYVAASPYFQHCLWAHFLSLDKCKGMLHVYSQSRHVTCTTHAQMCVTRLTQTYISNSYIFLMCHHVRPILRGALVMQVHAYVTYMSLKQPALDKWKGMPRHPKAAGVSTRPKRTGSQTRRHQKGVSKAGSGSQASPLKGHQSKGMKSKQLALFANASSLQPSRLLVLSTSAIGPQSPREEAMSFQLCFVQRVLAEGTSGTVYIARYTIWHTISALWACNFHGVTSFSRQASQRRQHTCIACILSVLSSL